MKTITKLFAAASALTLAACQQGGGGETNVSNALENASEAIDNAGEAIENASEAVDEAGTNGTGDKPADGAATDGAAPADNAAAGDKPAE